MATIHALKTAVASVENAQSEYRTQLAYLMLYSAQVKRYNFPVLAHTPTWYPEAQATWATMTGRLSAWSMSTLYNLVKTPAFLRMSSAEVVLPIMADAIDNAEHLVKEPGNNLARASLISDMMTLESKFRQFAMMTTTLAGDITRQARIFDQDAEAMVKLANQALNEAGVDRKKIQELNAAIKKFQDDIDSRIAPTVIGGFIAAIGIGLIIGAVIGAVFTGGASLALIIPGAAITAGGGVIIGLNAAAIVNDKAQIETARKTISEYEQDISYLNVMADSLKAFAQQSDKLKDALGVVAKPWEAAADYFSASVKTIKAIEDGSQHDWTTVRDELVDIRDHWNALMETMKGLEADATMSTVSLEVGMTEEQVKVALSDTSRQVSLIDYLAA